jgi:uncharacterized protein
MVCAPGHSEMSKSQLREFLEFAFERIVMGSLRLTPIGTTAEGERVAVEAQSSALLKAGGRYTNRYHFLFIVRDGKIRALNIYATNGLAVDAAWAVAS